MSGKLDVGNHHRYHLNISPYWILVAILVQIFFFIFLRSYSWISTIIFVPLFTVILYFTLISLYYTIIGLKSGRGNRTIRISSIISTMNNLSWLLAVFLFNDFGSLIAKSFISGFLLQYVTISSSLLETFLFFTPLVLIFLPTLSIIAFSLITQYNYEESLKLLSEIGINTDVWLILSGRTGIDEKNSIEEVSEFKGINKKEVRMKAIEYLKTTDRNFWYYTKNFPIQVYSTIVYLLISGAIILPLLVLFVLSVYLIFLIPTISLFYLLSAYVAGYNYSVIHTSEFSEQDNDVKSFEYSYVIALSSYYPVRYVFLVFFISSNIVLFQQVFSFGLVNSIISNLFRINLIITILIPIILLILVPKISSEIISTIQ